MMMMMMVVMVMVVVIMVITMMTLITMTLISSHRNRKGIKIMNKEISQLRVIFKFLKSFCRYRIQRGKVM
jgi:hypothetical protein